MALRPAGTESPLRMSGADECALLAFLYEQESIRLLRDTNYIDAADRRSQACLNFVEAQRALSSLGTVPRCNGGTSDVLLRLDIDATAAEQLARLVSGAAVLRFRMAVAAMFTGAEIERETAHDTLDYEHLAGNLPFLAFVVAADPVWQPEALERCTSQYEFARCEQLSRLESPGFDALMELVIAASKRRFEGGGAADETFNLFMRKQLHAATSAFDRSPARNSLFHLADLLAIGCERLLNGQSRASTH